MSRKTSDSHHGLHDVIGVALLGAALLILLAQITFNRGEISQITFPPDQSVHNLIGPFGAYLAWIIFLPFGVVAYLVPPLLAFFGAAYLMDFLSYVRERLRWSLLWSIMLLVSLTGLLYVFDPADHEKHVQLHDNIGTLSAGGWVGYLTYGKYPHWLCGLSLLGPVGALIIYTTLGLISLLFLTNFHLGVWVRTFLQKEKPGKSVIEDELEKSEEEIVLDRRKRELERQAKKLQEEVSRSGLGADGLPVPEPTVRDLSIPQFNKSGPKVRKTTLPGAPTTPIAPPDEGEVIPAKEISAAATTEEIIGRKSNAPEK